MSNTTYFWQGGNKIEVVQDAAAITIHADNPEDAHAMANRAGVQLLAAQPAANGLVRATVNLATRDEVVDSLRANDAVVHHVYRDQAGNGNEYMITESFFLKFLPDTDVDAIRDYLAQENLVVERDLGDKCFLVRVTTATGRNPIRCANAAASRPDVMYAEPNLIRRVSKFAYIPADDRFVQQWHLHAPADKPDLVAGAGIFAPEAWDLTRGQRDIVIAVADDGFDLTHPDFQGEGKVAMQLNAVPDINGGISWDTNVLPRAGDYHGTPCLGVAVAEGNGTGVVGVAPGCALVAVRFPLEQFNDAHFIAMFEKISTVADVVSCSWGVGPANAPMSLPLSEAISRLAQTGGRRGKGLIFCVAAGNSNCPVKDLDNTFPYPFLDRGANRIDTYGGVINRWIAAHPDVMTVSASTSRKTRSAYSSWGQQVSVCAPSNNWDDLGQQTFAGLGIVTTDNEGAGPRSDFTPGSRFTNRFGGTSSATPTVAGVCALILSANPGLSAQEVRSIIKTTADKDLTIFSDNPVNVAGDFDAGGFSQWFGYGKVNAFRAVQSALAGVANGRVVDEHNGTQLAIPENGLPVRSVIPVGQGGKIVELRVQLDITHTAIGDLRVDLLAPDGVSITLHNHRGGTTDNLVRTYSALNTPALRALQNRNVQGEWGLRILDRFPLNSGKLNSWRLMARVA